ncbi:glycosyltransferase [Halodurantibacterium flavum]|uniref:Glycosyltransferase n=1 Tax=Halodurantibacterium flavum TaxID=1382802 RepID=A0ABW4S7D1_9RHOB
MAQGRIAILMALCNGARYLPQQLDSIRGQSDTGWDLFVSDDGSVDEGPELARAFGAEVSKGPQAGFAANFLTLLRNVPERYEFASFSDQDDIWLPHKLLRAREAFGRLNDRRPALYCSRTMVCDAFLKPLAPSPRWRRPFGFANALVQNVAAGNTIVLNRAAISLAQQAAPMAMGVPAHDWWVYQLVTGAGGIVIRDDRPGLFYRQHGASQMGRNDTLAASLARMQKLAEGDFRRWNDANIAALGAVDYLLTDEARARLVQFAFARLLPLGPRLQGLRRAGIYRQTWTGTAALWAAAAAGRL